MHSYEKQALSGAIEILSQSELPDRFEGMKLYGCLLYTSMARFLERISLSEYRDKFILKGGCLLYTSIQLCLCRLQTLGHLGKGIVDTGKVSARVCTKGCPVGHLSFQQERIFLFPSGKFHGHGIAPI